MTHTYNGMPSSELPDVTWRKSAHSNPNGACVEVAVLPGGEIAFRNSRFPGGPALVYTRAEIAAFLAGAKDGEFDHVLNLCTFCEHKGMGMYSIVTRNPSLRGVGVGH